MSADLRVSNLRRTYGQVLAIDDFTFSFPSGKVTAVVGPSGSGKTTLLSMLAGLVRPDHGSVTLDGQDITDVPPEARDFGVVFQNYLLFPHLSVRENVEFGLRVRKMPRAERNRKVSELLEKLGLAALADRSVAAISGGEAQRVALGRALAFGPRILLLDEPLSALDAQLRESLRGELRRLLKELRITTVYVTHDQSEAHGLGEELVVLNRGLIEQAGSPLGIYTRPATRFVAEFLGSANVFRAECSERAGIRVLELPFARLPAPSEITPGAYWAILRPGDFEIADAGSEHFRAECLAAAFHGSFVRMTLRAQGHELVVDVPGEIGTEPRSAWKFRIKTEKIHLLPAGGGSPDRLRLSQSPL